jgi:hypothetical protein
MDKLIEMPDNPPIGWRTKIIAPKVLKLTAAANCAYLFQGNIEFKWPLTLRAVTIVATYLAPNLWHFVIV